MNERIQELREQALAACKSYEDNSVVRTNDAFEKFAELIVNDVEQELKDMAEWYSNAENYVAENTCYNFINHLNKLFRSK